MADERKEIRADVVQGILMGNAKKANQNHDPESRGPGSGPEKIPKTIWIPAIVIASLLLIFLLITFFLTPTLTPEQHNILRLIF